MFNFLKINLKGSLSVQLRAFFLAAKGSISIPALHYLRKIEYEPTQLPHYTDITALFTNHVELTGVQETLLVAKQTV